jgi:L-aminopeptidase/D-esterase-like protein
MADTIILRARDLGLGCGNLPPGTRNSIVDIPGVAVAHRTIVEGELRTGVTAIFPHLVFLAAAEAMQESVYDALAAADTTTGRSGHMLPGLRHALGRSL